MRLLVRAALIAVGLVVGGLVLTTRRTKSFRETQPAGPDRDLKEDRPAVQPSEQESPESRSHTTSQKTKRRVLQIVGLLVLLAVGGFLVAASGVIPVKASSGHWPITAWFLNFTMSRSVSTHSLGLNAPPLDDPTLVLKGAGHYETGCRPCHGSPQLHHPRIPQAMTPHPPYLPPRIPEWDPEELFYIVKHGVKFTGMPAWPAQQRDDEVWAMAAFLLAYPELDADEYDRLVHGEAPVHREVAAISGLPGPESVPPAVAESCARCHGQDGLGRGLGAFPKLAGQSAAYLTAALEAYSFGNRHSGIMEPLAAGLDRESIQKIADYYSRLNRPPSGPVSQVGPEIRAAVDRGEAIAHHGVPDQRVAACIHCHGPAPTPRNPFYPELAGQYPEYLVLQLELFKKKQRGGSSYAHVMQPIAGRLTNQQMQDVALYYGTLTSTPSDP